MEHKPPSVALLGHDPKFFKVNRKTPVEIRLLVHKCYSTIHFKASIFKCSCRRWLFKPWCCQVLLLFQ